MNPNMILQEHTDHLVAVTRRADDGTNDGSILYIQGPGWAYCIAKAPRYATDEEWLHNANRIIKALQNYKEEN